MKHIATKLLPAFSAFVASLTMVHTAIASDCAVDSYDHNGSVMEVYFCDSGVNIAYDKPRSSLRKHGVKSGTLLFEGSAAYGGKISGTAKVFKRGCGTLAYPVSGRQKGKRIILNGRAPVRGSNCDIRHYRNDRLVFTLISN